MTQSEIWEDRYEQLRTIHARLKILRGCDINGIPHFFISPKSSGDDRYDKALEIIDKKLYSAERVCAKLMN
jgi:hypothetical protein